MQQGGSILRSLFKARRLFLVFITALIAVSFTVTALMKGNNGDPVQRNKKASQGQSKNDPTADFWQRLPGMQADASSRQAAFSGKQVDLQLKRFRPFTLNRGLMQGKLAAAPLESPKARKPSAMTSHGRA